MCIHCANQTTKHGQSFAPVNRRQSGLYMMARVQGASKKRLPTVPTMPVRMAERSVWTLATNRLLWG